MLAWALFSSISVFMLSYTNHLLAVVWYQTHRGISLISLPPEYLLREISVQFLPPWLWHKFTIKWYSFFFYELDSALGNIRDSISIQSAFYKSYCPYLHHLMLTSIAWPNTNVEPSNITLTHPLLVKQLLHASKVHSFISVKDLCSS